MSVKLYTEDPVALLNAIKAAIDSKRTKSWSYDKDGDFTLEMDQRRYHAWLRPTVESDHLLLRVVAPRNRAVTIADYAIYHGRFVELVLRYCDHEFTRSVVTAMPDDGDSVGSSS